jgi:hypothetical protein
MIDRNVGALSQILQRDGLANSRGAAGDACGLGL